MIQIGCVADDFTGASDWASFFAEKGVRVLLYNGVPDGWMDPIESDVVVIALKTRTMPVEEALNEAGRALRWLEEHETKRFYIKYCSTFDSTRHGNIGPITDLAMDMLGEKMSILCPALPVNGRTVKDGCLYVDGVELQKSPMKDHPLTPMWDCRISELMKEQSRNDVISLTADLYRDPTAAWEWIRTHMQGESKVYFVPDFYEQGHGEKIAGLFDQCRLLTGGSGLCTYLADRIQPSASVSFTGISERAVIIAGSCSQATLKQIDCYLASGKRAVKMEPFKLLDGTETVESIWELISDCEDEEILIYSSEEPSCVAKNQKMGKKKIAALIESIQAELAKRFVAFGRKRIIVAGGETSGAITKKLGYRSYFIGKSIAPGVPVMIPVFDEQVRLVLKSGNFGQEDFFLRALEVTKNG